MNESFNNTKIEKDHYRNQMEINSKKTGTALLERRQNEIDDRMPGGDERDKTCTSRNH